MNFYVRSIFLSITTNGEKALTETRIHMHNELKKKKKRKTHERKGRMIRQWIFYRERDRDKILFYQTKWRGAFVSQLVWRRRSGFEYFPNGLGRHVDDVADPSHISQGRISRINDTELKSTGTGINFRVPINKTIFGSRFDIFPNERIQLFFFVYTFLPRSTFFFSKNFKNPTQKLISTAWRPSPLQITIDFLRVCENKNREEIIYIIF